MTSKKGDLNLSINAIVVLILAITMLGLGLAFMRNVFADKNPTLVGSCIDLRWDGCKMWEDLHPEAEAVDQSFVRGEFYECCGFVETNGSIEKICGYSRKQLVSYTTEDKTDAQCWGGGNWTPYLTFNETFAPHTSDAISPTVYPQEAVFYNCPDGINRTVLVENEDQQFTFNPEGCSGSSHRAEVKE